LAERYIEEGLRHDEHPLIYFRDREIGRRPALLGTRLDVAEVISTIARTTTPPMRPPTTSRSRSSISTPA
jgi:hypothetical protein